MSAAEVIANPNAIVPTDQCVGGFTTSGRSISALAERARKLWGNKVAAELAQVTGMSVRSAERWLAGDRSPSGDAVVMLLQSDNGPAFLEALIETMPAEAQVRWRNEFDLAAERALLRRGQDEINRRQLAVSRGKLGL